MWKASAARDSLIKCLLGCSAHHPAINRAVELVRDCIDACGVTAYAEASGQGELRYLQLTIVDGPAGPAPGAAPGAATAPMVQLVLVWNSQPEAPCTRRLSELAGNIWKAAGQPGHNSSSEEGLMHSIWANFQPITFGPGANNILGPDWRLLHGSELAWTRLGGAEICFGPGSFLQVCPGSSHPCHARA